VNIKSAIVRRLSQLIIDSDLKLASYKLKFATTMLKDLGGDILRLRNSADTSYTTLWLENLLVNNAVLFQNTGSYISTPNADGAYTLLRTRRDGVGLKEVARLASGVEEAFELLKGKLTGELKANGQTISGLVLPLLAGDAANKQYVDRASYAAYKDSDQAVNNSTALVSIDGLGLSLIAAGTYKVRYWIKHNTSTVADLKLAFSYPAGCTIEWFDSLDEAGSASGILPLSDQTYVLVVEGAGADRLIWIEAVIKNGANDGILNLQFAQNTAEVSDTKILASSHAIVNLLD